MYNLTLFYSVSLIYFFGAATAFDIFGNDNAEELLTCGFQYPSLPISILHFVARILGQLEKKSCSQKKKVLVICLAGVRSLLRPEKKVLVVCLAGAQSLLLPEKKF